MSPHPVSPHATPFPAHLTTFIGRVAELRSVTAELDRQRLVSLVGPGGAGKTRLAIEAGRARHGRWFVDLAMVATEEGVQAALAAAVDAIEAPGESPLQAAIRRIGDADGLLLVDNCDQVVEACAHAIDALLRGCPRLTILTTSREPLRVEGERVWRIPPLSLPSDDGELDGDAVLLFLDRASMPAAEAARNGARIREICRHLDGMPLAIELAAARATALPVADILSGLSDRFRLLTRGTRSSDQRQRSLAESIRWSYQLLSGDEQAVLQRIGVFRGPFSANAARAVAADHEVDARDVFAILANLVEKSFVVIDDRAADLRYRLLETIREYAAGELAKGPDTGSATHARHLVFLRDLAERIEPVFDGPDIEHWIGLLGAQLTDITAAVAWAAETTAPDDALRLTGALSKYLWLTARSGTQQTVEAALRIHGGTDRARARALTAACAAAGARFDPHAAEFGRQAVELAEDLGDPALAAPAEAHLGWALAQVEPTRARTHLRRAVDLARGVGDDWCLAIALVGLAGVELGDVPTARAHAEEAIALATAHHHQLTLFPAAVWLTALNLLQGRFDDATRTAQTGMEIAKRLGTGVDVTWLRWMQLWHAVLVGDHEAAEIAERNVAAAAAVSGHPLFLAYARAAAGQRRHAIGDDAEARKLLASALPIATRFPRAGGAFFAEMLADSALADHDLAAAATHTGQAVELAETAASNWGRSRAGVAQCRLKLALGDVPAAAQAAHDALGVAVRNNDPITSVDVLELLADVTARRHDPRNAARLLGAAQAERRRLGYAHTTPSAGRRDTLVHGLTAALGDVELTRLLDDGAQHALSGAVALAGRLRQRKDRPEMGWDSLTPAEHRVVEFVGAGLTNRQIAERLYISPDTVKGHVSAALRKLAVTNRTELAAEAARQAQ